MEFLLGSAWFFKKGICLMSIHHWNTSAMWAGTTGFCAPTSIKISLCVKNLSKQQILNLEISIETDSETIVLSQKELLYIEPVKNDIMVRFESFISPEQMAHLVSKGIKSINIKKSKNETIAAFNGKKLNKKLFFLSKYLWKNL